MARVQFYPVDATYKIVDGRPAVYLFGRTPAGEQVCIIDRNFEPYFWVVPEKNADVTQQLLALSAAGNHGEFFVARVEDATRNYREQPVRALKVFTNVPKAVAQLRESARKLPGVQHVLEADIPFVRRYFIDKGIIPLTLHDVDGEPVSENLKVPALRATAITSAEGPAFAPRVLAVDIETYNPDGKHVDPEKNPIVMLALAGNNVRKVLTWKHFPDADKTVEFVKSEADLLDRFADIVDDCRPDIIIGYFSDGFDFPYIKKRAEKYKLRLRFGLDHSELAIEGRGNPAARITGIAHVDVFKVIRRLFVKALETDVFTLDAVAAEILGKHKHPAPIDRLAQAWDANDAALLREFCAYNLQDAVLTLELCGKVFPNLAEFVKLVGQQPYDINRMGFSQLVEWYVLRLAFAANELAPNKPHHREHLSRTMDRIKGAFVYEPTPGLYENIAVFDFRSLYPTIIASHNVSPGMLNCACCEGQDSIATGRGTFWYCKKRKGFVSIIIEDLITRRSRIKKMLKQDHDVALEARSTALKDLANSFYGYLGFAPARWYCIECAESTTAFARRYITAAIDQAKKEGFTVLYSDTDSVFLLLQDKTQKDAEAFAERINNTLPGLMELEFQGHYPAGIFVPVKASEHGAKKKYALIDAKGNLTITGFETVRRNVSFIAKTVQKKVLHILLEKRDTAAALTYVKDVIARLRRHEEPVDHLIIRTQLQKPIEEYESQGPHVAAAARMQARNDPVGPGSVIPYVVIKGKGRIRDKVRLPDEAKQEEYDPEYYVNNQVIPAVDRIFAVFNISVDELAAEKEQQKLGGYL